MTAKAPTYFPALNQVRSWVAEVLATPGRRGEGESATARERSRRISLAVACAIIFLIASGVRLLHWQDSHLNNGLGSLTHRYLKHAQQMLDGERVLFPRDYDEPTNVQLLVHPPGYSIFAAAIFGLFGNSNEALRLAQIIADGAAAVMVAIIAAELFPLTVGVLAGLFVAFSPHLAHYSLFLLPDSLSALPILIAIYFVIRAGKRPRLVPIIAAGFFIGLSCWLRSNTLLLAPFVALAVALTVERGRRLRYSLALIAAALVTISPITIRNLIVFHRFIPLSLGAGITMIEGIADYDKENRFGMPQTDLETKLRDVQWHNRPDYNEGLWKPDGIYRDQYRLRRGLEVIRSNPVWFGGVMIRRAAFMLRYNSPTSEGWPFDTARVPVVSLEPGFGHKLVIPAGSQPAWANSAKDLKDSGKTLAPQAKIALSADGQTLMISGDESEFGDQFISEPIAVEKNTDYVLRLPARYAQSPMAAKVTSINRRIALASALIVEPEDKVKQRARIKLGYGVDDSIEDEPQLPNDADSSLALEMPFATGNRNEVLLVISNNGPSAGHSVEIGGAELYEAGPTPAMWTRILRPTVRGVQRNLYTTSRMLPLIVVGIFLLAMARRESILLALLCVPAYYLLAQSAFHTEYRYILAIHYFLFIMAGVTLFCAGKLIKLGTDRVISAASGKHTRAAL